MTLTHLSTTALLHGLTALLRNERRTLARLLAHLIEVEERRVHLELACSSLTDFCVRKLGLSEHEAYRRINAARLARRFPVILRLIEEGRLHLSALAVLRDYLTEENHAELLRDASGKSTRQLQELLAERFRGGQTCLDDSLLPTRYRVQLTASAELKAKLERATQLMRHRCPDGDLAAVVDRALDLLIPALEKERFGKTPRPRTPRGAKSAYVTRAVRREVFARDGEQCTFVSEAGERCPARTFLEFDHVRPKALGGTGDATNVRLLCRSHNQLEAERRFGRMHVAEKVSSRRDRRRAERDGSEAVFEVAVRALTSMGFRSGEARGAVNDLRARQGQGSTTVPVIEDVLRAALRLLSDAGLRC